MRQKFQYLTTEQLQALHGDDFLEIVIATRARIQMMNPERVAEATDRSLQCILNFVSGETRVPRSSTLSAMLRLLVEEEPAVKVGDPFRPLVVQRRRNPRKNPRFVRPVRRSVARDRKTA